MEEMCFNNELIYYYMFPFAFGIFFLAIFLMLMMTYDYYQYQVQLLTLQEKLELLDLEMGLRRDLLPTPATM
jgi:hypothetical protein